MKVGFAHINITPNLDEREEPLQLGGYSPRKLCTGVHDDLYARAVYVEGNEEDPESHILMIVCDLLYIDGKFADIVKKRISEKIPIETENILISATHTHHGPDFKGLFVPGGNLVLIKGFLFPNPDSFELIQIGKKLIRIAKEAYKNRKSAAIGATQSKIPESKRVMINRRDPFNFQSADYPLTIIKIESRENGEQGSILGLIINYACHGTVLPRANTLISADYVGYIAKALEAELPTLNGNFVYFNGPCGEINPLSSELKRKMRLKGPNGLTRADIYNQNGTWKDAERIGSVIATQAIKYLDRIDCKETIKLKAVEENIKIPIRDYPYGSDFRSVINKILYKVKVHLYNGLIKCGILKSNIFFNLDQIKGKSQLISKIQAFQFGDILIGTTPGEYFLQLGMEVINSVRQKYPGTMPFIVELANDSLGYLYTIDAYLEGGYESSFSIIPLGGRFITQKLKALLSRLRKEE